MRILLFQGNKNVMNERETLKINEKGHLEIGGADCVDLAERFGTPVYLFDEEFSDGPRYILQAAEPLLTEGGSLTLEEGKFVYVYCSANAFTDLAPDSDAKLLVTFAE